MLERDPYLRAENRKVPSHRFSVAPMMACTDRHCRYFHRLLSRQALLYTEMLHAQAVVHGKAEQLLAFNEAERPLALQLGGSDPRSLGEAARIGVEAGYNEINLNAGCPSPRVRKCNFGAVLMTMPDVAGDCMEAILENAAGASVSVKCRIGVDNQDPNQALPRFVETVASRGVDRVIVHARKALLSGLSPKQNHNVPPLDHGLVVRLKQQFPHLAICINGGITDLGQVGKLLDQGLDGVMVGRTAYNRPLAILPGVDEQVFGVPRQFSIERIIEEMCTYALRQEARGIPIRQVSRHMSGLFAGWPHARNWRRVVSDPGIPGEGGVDAIREAAKRCLDGSQTEPSAVAIGMA